MWRKILIIFTIVLVVLGALFYARTREPKPQIAFRPGLAAPDFTLQDQDGHTFHLADQRGRSVVLIFYRGYW